MEYLRVQDIRIYKYKCLVISFKINFLSLRHKLLNVYKLPLKKSSLIDISGLWGEIRKWDDGTTIVQKTHDASKHHVLKVYFVYSINKNIIICNSAKKMKCSI